MPLWYPPVLQLLLRLCERTATLSSINLATSTFARVPFFGSFEAVVLDFLIKTAVSSEETCAFLMLLSAARAISATSFLRSLRVSSKTLTASSVSTFFALKTRIAAKRSSGCSSRAALMSAVTASSLKPPISPNASAANARYCEFCARSPTTSVRLSLVTRPSFIKRGRESINSITDAGTPKTMFILPIFTSRGILRDSYVASAPFFGIRLNTAATSSWNSLFSLSSGSAKKPASGFMAANAAEYSSFR